MGEHTKALEENGFEIVKLINLSPHYAKTTAAWYERMMASEEEMISEMNEFAAAVENNKELAPFAEGEVPFP